MNQVAVQRDRRGPKIFIGRKTKLYARAGCTLAKIPLTGPIKLVPRFGVEFEKEKKTTAVRSESFIMHRWLTIQAQVNKFCSCYAAIEHRNKSRTTIQDKVCHMCSIYYSHFVYLKKVQIAEASKMYMELDKDKKSFTLIPCWNILKEEDKWKAKMIELAELEKQAIKKKKVHQDVQAKGYRSNQ